MYRKAGEAHFHTPEQVAAYLDEALRITAEAGVSDETRGPLLLKLVDLLAQKQVWFDQVTPAGVVLDRAPRG